MPSKVPSINPLWAPDAICTTCGEVMRKSTDKSPTGRVSKVVYTCENEKTGCSYTCESDVKLQGQSKPYTKVVAKAVAMLLFAVFSMTALCQNSDPEHLYPTDDEAVILYRITLKRQHIIEDANSKIVVIDKELKDAADKIIKDHELGGKFIYNVNTGSFENVADKPKTEKK
jgi:hypothetical protein